MERVELFELVLRVHQTERYHIKRIKKTMQLTLRFVLQQI